MLRRAAGPRESPAARALNSVTSALESASRVVHIHHLHSGYAVIGTHPRLCVYIQFLRNAFARRQWQKLSGFLKARADTMEGKYKAALRPGSMHGGGHRSLSFGLGRLDVFVNDEKYEGVDRRRRLTARARLHVRAEASRYLWWYGRDVS